MKDKSGEKWVQVGHELMEMEFNRAIVSIPLASRKIFEVMIASIKDPRMDQKLRGRRFNLVELARAIGREGDGGSLYKSIREAIEWLQTHVATFTDRKTGDKIVTQFVAPVRYAKDETWVDLRIPKEMKSAILELESDYMKYRLATALQFRSKQAGNFFLMLKLYDHGKMSFIKSIEEIKEYIGINKEKYSLFKEFNSYVLKRINKSLMDNPECPIYATWEKANPQKKVTELRFFIHRKKGVEKIKKVNELSFKKLMSKEKKAYWIWLRENQPNDNLPEKPDWNLIEYKERAIHHFLNDQKKANH